MSTNKIHWKRNSISNFFQNEFEMLNRRNILPKYDRSLTEYKTGTYNNVSKPEVYWLIILFVFY